MIILVVLVVVVVVGGVGGVGVVVVLVVLLERKQESLYATKPRTRKEFLRSVSVRILMFSYAFLRLGLESASVRILTFSYVFLWFLTVSYGRCFPRFSSAKVQP